MHGIAAGQLFLDHPVTTVITIHVPVFFNYLGTVTPPARRSRQFIGGQRRQNDPFTPPVIVHDIRIVRFSPVHPSCQEQFPFEIGKSIYDFPILVRCPGYRQFTGSIQTASDESDILSVIFRPELSTRQLSGICIDEIFSLDRFPVFYPSRSGSVSLTDTIQRGVSVDTSGIIVCIPVIISISVRQRQRFTDGPVENIITEGEVQVFPLRRSAYLHGFRMLSEIIVVQYFFSEAVAVIGGHDPVFYVVSVFILPFCRTDNPRAAGKDKYKEIISIFHDFPNILDLYISVNVCHIYLSEFRSVIFIGG